MKYFAPFSAGKLSRALVLLTALVTLALPARAGLTVDVHLYHDNFGYYFYPYLSANASLPNFPTGIYQIASPQIPANGSRLIYQAFLRSALALTVPSMTLRESRDRIHQRAPVAKRQFSAILGAAFRNADTRHK